MTSLGPPTVHRREMPQIDLRFPLPVDEGSQFRLDLQPIIDRLSKVGVLPTLNIDDGLPAAESVAAYWFDAHLRHNDTPEIVPIIPFLHVQDPGLVVNMTTTGCRFAHSTWWKEANEKYCAVNGAVVTGPLIDGETQPELIISVTYPFPRRDKPSGQERTGPMNDLAELISLVFGI